MFCCKTKYFSVSRAVSKSFYLCKITFLMIGFNESSLMLFQLYSNVILWCHPKYYEYNLWVTSTAGQPVFTVSTNVSITSIRNTLYSAWTPSCASESKAYNPFDLKTVSQILVIYDIPKTRFALFSVGCNLFDKSRQNWEVIYTFRVINKNTFQYCL